MEERQNEEITKEIEEERKWCVYIHRNMINNKSYIGITSQPPIDRWGVDGHKYDGEHKVFYRAIKKYGWDNFEHIIWAENLTELEAKHMEIVLIALFKTNCCRYRNPEYGYNLTDGGDGICGYRHTDETKDKMSIAQKNRFKDPKNHPMFGVHRFGEDNPNYGNHKLAGKNNPNYGNVKPVVQLSVDNQPINIFNSVGQASEFTGIFATQIYAACVNKPHYNTAGGYVWKYVYDYTMKNGTLILGAITLDYITEEEVLKQLNKLK